MDRFVKDFLRDQQALYKYESLYVRDEYDDVVLAVGDTNDIHDDTNYDEDDDDPSTTRNFVVLVSDNARVFADAVPKVFHLQNITNNTDRRKRDRWATSPTATSMSGITTKGNSNGNSNGNGNSNTITTSLRRDTITRSDSFLVCPTRRQGTNSPLRCVQHQRTSSNAHRTRPLLVREMSDSFLIKPRRRGFLVRQREDTTSTSTTSSITKAIAGGGPRLDKRVDSCQNFYSINSKARANASAKHGQNGTGDGSLNASWNSVVDEATSYDLQGMDSDDDESE